MKKPNRLNLEQMWNLYLFLKPALENRELKSILLDEVEELLLLSKPGTLFAVLNVLYDNISRDMSGMDAIIDLMNGLDNNDFYGFVSIVKAIKDVPAK